MIYLTRRESFSASHRLNSSELSPEENERVFGKCNNYYGHGHNYVLEVTLKGEPDKTTGYLIDLKILKKIIREEIVDRVDHKHLNFDVDFLSGVNPTCENLAVAFWGRLVGRFPAGMLYSVRVSETKNNYCEFRGN